MNTLYLDNNHITLVGKVTSEKKLSHEIYGEKFYIFDACGNFEYFDMNPDGAKTSDTMPISQKVFLKKLELAEKIKDDDEILRLLSKKIKDDLCSTVKTMDRDNFIVRRQLETVESFSARERWDNIDDIDFINIEKKLSKLPNKNEDEEETCKSFDLMILNSQLAIYGKDAKKLEKYQKDLIKIASKLEQKSSIPMVNKELEIIQEIQTDEFWRNVTISDLENVRIRLRDLIKFLDKEQREMVVTNFEDESITNIQPQTVQNPVPNIDMERYEKKVKAFLLEHKDMLALYKLQHNKKLTNVDIEQLQKILEQNSDIGSIENLYNLQGGLGLGEFIRKIIGLDVESIKEVFAEYLDNNKFNSNQIRFIEMIIEYLRVNGTMLDLSILYEQPFTYSNTDGIDGVFSSNDSDKIIHLIKTINDNAIISL